MLVIVSLKIGKTYQILVFAGFYRRDLFKSQIIQHRKVNPHIIEMRSFY